MSETSTGDGREPAAAPTGRRTSPPGPQLWPVLVVGVGVLLGLGIAVLGAGRWRLGCLVVGCSLGLGAVIRLALPARAAGLLQVRSRAFDVAAMLLGGAAIVALAFWVPGR